MPNNDQFSAAIKERFDKLPKVIQDAITSADVEAHLRELAKGQNLHLDQWEGLENEVYMTLLGIHPAENLPENIQKIGVSAETAQLLATSISSVVFDPVRKELERELEHPAATAATTTGVEDMRAGVLAQNAEQNNPTPTPPAAPIEPPESQSSIASETPTVQAAPTQSSVTPATPPTAPATATVERAPAPTTYTPTTPSHERKTIEGDPYREQLI